MLPARDPLDPLRREVLWNGNTEGPLREFFTDRDHIIRSSRIIDEC